MVGSGIVVGREDWIKKIDRTELGVSCLSASVRQIACLFVCVCLVISQKSLQRTDTDRQTNKRPNLPHSHTPNPPAPLLPSPDTSTMPPEQEKEKDQEQDQEQEQEQDQEQEQENDQENDQENEQENEPESDPKLAIQMEDLILPIEKTTFKVSSFSFDWVMLKDGASPSQLVAHVVGAWKAISPGKPFEAIYGLVLSTMEGERSRLTAARQQTDQTMEAVVKRFCASLFKPEDRTLHYRAMVQVNKRPLSTTYN